jgi:hypothetical protein
VMVNCVPIRYTIMVPMIVDLHSCWAIFASMNSVKDEEVNDGTVD